MKTRRARAGRRHVRLAALVLLLGLPVEEASGESRRPNPTGSGASRARELLRRTIAPSRLPPRAARGWRRGLVRQLAMAGGRGFVVVDSTDLVPPAVARLAFDRLTGAGAGRARQPAGELMIVQATTAFGGRTGRAMRHISDESLLARLGDVAGPAILALIAHIEAEAHAVFGDETDGHLAVNHIALRWSSGPFAVEGVTPATGMWHRDGNTYLTAATTLLGPGTHFAPDEPYVARRRADDPTTMTRQTRPGETVWFSGYERGLAFGGVGPSKPLVHRAPPAATRVEPRLFLVVNFDTKQPPP